MHQNASERPKTLKSEGPTRAAETSANRRPLPLGSRRQGARFDYVTGLPTFLWDFRDRQGWREVFNLDGVLA